MFERIFNTRYWIKSLEVFPMVSNLPLGSGRVSIWHWKRQLRNTPYLYFVIKGTEETVLIQNRLFMQHISYGRKLLMETKALELSRTILHYRRKKSIYYYSWWDLIIPSSNLYNIEKKNSTGNVFIRAYNSHF